jgi:hypothetical protein
VDLEKLTELPGPVSWSPDGRFLLYADIESKYQVMEVATRQSRVLLDDDGARLPVSWGGARWSPDSTFIVLSGASERSAWRWWRGVTYTAVMDAMAPSTR